MKKKGFKRCLFLCILVCAVAVIYIYQRPQTKTANTSTIKAKKATNFATSAKPKKKKPTLAAGMIFNTQKNENGDYRNGQQGDQTSKEARIMAYPAYYQDSSYPWSFQLHCTRKDVRSQVAKNAIAAAANNHIGYDSGDLRMTLWDQVVQCDYDFSKVDTDCAANCVSSALIFYKTAGYQLGIKELQDIDISIHLWDVDTVLLGTGLFEKRGDASYLHTTKRGVAGDVYVAESRHVIVQVSDGE